MPEEIEIKLPVRDLATIRDRLAGAGAVCHGAAAEENLIFDRDEELKGRGEVLRLRRDDRVWLTWKGPAVVEAGVKSRSEIQTTLQDFAAAQEILERLGYQVAVSYAKHRETWELEGADVTLDQLEFGEFVEIEGGRECIDRVARRLGLDLTAALNENYVELQARSRAGTLQIDRYADATSPD